MEGGGGGRGREVRKEGGKTHVIYMNAFSFKLTWVLKAFYFKYIVLSITQTHFTVKFELFYTTGD